MPHKEPCKTVDDPQTELLNHIRELGLQSAEQYKLWCARSGFGTRLKKSARQRCEERNYLERVVIQKQLQRQKREKRRGVETLTAVCEGRCAGDGLAQPHLARLQHLLRESGNHHECRVSGKVLSELVAHLHRCRSRLLNGSIVIPAAGESAGTTFIEALALVAVHCGYWLRDVQEWHPRSHSARRQFASLLRHLFVQYKMPVFFDSAWFAGRGEAAAERRSWYVRVGRGRSIRDCSLPIPYTKRMAHFFMQAPSDMNVDQAIRWGQVHGLGGDERLARTLAGTRLGRSFQSDEFWTTVIRWFVQHPLLDRTHVGPIIDYLHCQRFMPDAGGGPGGDGGIRPRQPNLTMKGRTPETLLRRVREWYGVLARDNRHQVHEWKPSGIEPLEFVEGSRNNGTFRRWTIRELLGGKALIAEGRQMKHCVASYSWSCARGECSIWTMETDTSDGHQKQLTVEVRNRSRVICQARGKANRLPTDKERSILRRWVERAGLGLSSCV